MFFQGGNQGGRFYRFQYGGPRRPQQHHEGGGGGGGGGGIFSFIHFLPLLLLILFTFMSSPSSDGNPYSLERNDHFNIQRKTPQTGIPFFVSASFNQRYGRDPRHLRQVEEMVEQQTFSKLEEKCKTERLAQKRAVNEAKRVKGPNQAEALYRAHHMEMPSCVHLDELYNLA